MQSIQDIIKGDEIKERFTELRQELGSDKLKYDEDSLCKIYQELYKKGYIISGFIGSGGQAVVFEAIRDDDKSIVAVKCVPYLLEEAKEAVKKEVEILEKLQNQPFIHQFLGGFNSTDNNFFFYVTEKLTCDLTSIMNSLASKEQQLPYNSIIAFMIHMTKALLVLKQNNVFHFDLKPDNILYDKQAKCFKLADYGMAKIKSHSNLSYTVTRAGGTYKYLAPESIEFLGGDKKERKESDRSDVFSLGLVLVELLKNSFLEEGDAALLRNDHSGKVLLQHLTSQYVQFNEIIKQMLIIDRSKRITPEDLLQKLESLQNEQESNFYTYLQTQVTQIDDFTFQGIKQLYSSSLTQVNLDSIVIDSSKRIFMRHHSLKFKDIRTVKELTEVEEALTKYQNDINTGLDVGLQLSSYVYMDFNEFTKLGASVAASRLASGLGKCSASITSLSLKFSSLKIGPEGMKSISQSIGMMHQNLTTLILDFYRVEIGPEGASSLATAIEKCSQNLLVVGLMFVNCNIGSDEIKYLSSSLEKCGKMTTLGLFLYGYDDKVKIGPTGASYLASSLPKCKSLTEFTLSLECCGIQAEDLQSIGSGLEKCEKLIRLNIQICHNSKESPINEQSIEEFGSSLARCHNLITLSVDLGHAYAITPSLPLFAKLTTLTLFLGETDAKNISTLQTNLKEYQNLTSLCLCMNEYDGYCTLNNTTSLVESLEKSDLTTLKLIFMHHGFRDQQQQQANRLGESLSKFKKLASLYLFFECNCGNHTQFISTLLSNHLAKNTNITTLSLGALHCLLTSSDSKMIGESLEKCKYLQTLNLYLWGNKIKSKGALTISKNLQKCVHLTALELSIVERDHCCYDKNHKHIYIGSVSSTITNDLKKCKNLGELKVKARSTRDNETGFLSTYFDRKMLIKLGILTQFEYNFFGNSAVVW